MAALVGVGVGLFRNHERSYQMVLVTPPKAVKIQIFPDKKTSEIPSPDTSSTALAELSSPQTIKLKVGVYDALVTDTKNQFTTTVVQITVAVGTSAIEVNPAFSDSYLKQLLAVENSSIHTALQQAYPKYEASYRIGDEKLFGEGVWYGVRLQPISSNYDEERIILHKNGDKWEIVSAPPNIVQGLPSNPSVPLKVLQGVNALGISAQ